MEVFNRELNNNSNYVNILNNFFNTTEFDMFCEKNVLELLLSFSQTKSDINVISEKLLSNFGSFSNVIEAPEKLLNKIEGIDEKVVTIIKFFNSAFQYYIKNKTKDTIIINSKEIAVEFFRPYFFSPEYEIIVVLLVDSKGCIIKSINITQNKTNQVIADLTQIIQEAKSNFAKGIWIAHNHPHGFAKPSIEDIDMTLELSDLCKSNDIKLCEHIIFSGDDIYFLSASKHINDDVFI